MQTDEALKGPSGRLRLAGRWLRQVAGLEATLGVLLVLAAALALGLANSPGAGWYERFLAMPVVLQLGDFAIDKPALLWINDGLMAVFFLLVGLEIKRELVAGNLSRLSDVAFPAAAAAGGMLLPALIYTALNRGDALALSGWAIPAATDIAFALGVLSLFGSRVPVALKVFLLTVAVLDDLGAIVIIALFYTAELSTGSLAMAAVLLALLVGMNRVGVLRVAPYLLVGTLLWVAVLKSGVHATLAGVALAFTIPHGTGAHGSGQHAPLEALEHDVHPWVTFMVLPLFAFANAGVSLAGVTFARLLDPIPLGIAAGLLLGKQAGVLGAAWLGARSGLLQLPQGVSWPQIYGVAALCGIGFTMSLFIGSLAFEHAGAAYGTDVRLGILAGSLISAVLGAAVLHRALPAREGAS